MVADIYPVPLATLRIIEVKTRILIVIIILSTLGLVLALRQGGEPRYQKKPLSEWLERLRMDRTDAAALVAVRSIGTNAIPYLLEMVRYRPSEARIRLSRSANKLLAALGFRNRHFVTLLCCVTHKERSALSHSAQQLARRCRLSEVY